MSASSLTQRSPLPAIRDELQQLFAHSWPEGSFFGRLGGTWMPRMNLYEGDDTITVRMDMPGVRQEDLDIRFDEGVLTIAGERREMEAHEDESCYCSERYEGRFSRSIHVPTSHIKTQGTKATLDEGVLEVVLPKERGSTPHHIPIQTPAGANGAIPVTKSGQRRRTRSTPR